ncbi:MAG: hypothetical protein AAFP76_16590 [Bacteroidota bacterium]
MTAARRFSIIGLICFFTFGSCKTLNRKLSYQELTQTASVDAKKLFEQPQFNECDRGHKKFDDIVLKCNMWGRSKIKKGTPELCTFQKGNAYGWKWQMPKNARGVIAYPALEVGRSPWGNKSRPGAAGFPIKVADITELNSSFDVETHVKHRKYNLAFDFWLTDVEMASNENITTEIMIWEDYFDFSSFGKVIDKIQTPFGEYKVHKGHLKNSKFVQDWTYIAFVRTQPRSKGTVDILYLLKYLVDNDHINAQHYFTSIEFGNEIGNSSGLTLIKEFDWNFQSL